MRPLQLSGRRSKTECGNAHFPTLPAPPPPPPSPHRCNDPENGFKAVSQWRPGKESRTDQQSSVADRAQLLTRGTEQKWVNG